MLKNYFYFGTNTGGISDAGDIRKDGEGIELSETVKQLKALANQRLMNDKTLQAIVEAIESVKLKDELVQALNATKDWVPQYQLEHIQRLLKKAGKGAA